MDPKDENGLAVVFLVILVGLAVAAWRIIKGMRK
jgi:hypothetical protein